MTGALRICAVLAAVATLAFAETPSEITVGIAMD